MRRLQKGEKRKPRKRTEPLAEGIRKKRRSWASMSDDEIVSFVKKFIQEKMIVSKAELKKIDAGMYFVLSRRRLLRFIGFDKTRRDWASMNDDELVEEARRVITENEISGRKGLYRTDSGLYDALRKRGLIGAVGLELKTRDWSSMSDNELVEYAQKVMEKKGIRGRKELKKVDQGLYEVLRRRRLLDYVFAPVESAQQKEAVQDVVDAMKEF